MNSDNLRGRVLAALSYVNPDDRQEWVEIGAMLHSSELPDSKEIWLDWSRQSEKFNERDAEAVWKSFKPSGGLSLGTLFFRGSKQGWNGVADGVVVGMRSGGPGPPSNGVLKAKPALKEYWTIEKAEEAILYGIQRDEAYQGCTEFRVQSFPYHDEKGHVATVAVRVDYCDANNEADKTFRMLRNGHGRYSLGGMDGSRPLYKLPLVAKAETVIVVEGEKCADALNLLFAAVERTDIIATTSIGGAQSPGKTDWSLIVGKQVYVWPDNDEAGEKYLEAVVELNAAPWTPVKVIRPNNMPEKGDAADWLGPDTTAFGDSTEPLEIMVLLQQLLDSTIPCNNTDDDVAAVPVADDEPPALEYKPFPVDILPEPLRSFITSVADSIGCDYSYVTLPLLTAIGSAIGTSRSLHIKGDWFVRPILWSVIVGESGMAKTPAIHAAMRMIQDRESELIKTAIEEEEKWKLDCKQTAKDLTKWNRANSDDSSPPEEPKKPVVERFLVIDTTIEALAPILRDNPRGLLLARDELSGWFGSHDKYSKGKSDASNWLSMFNGGQVIVDRKGGSTIPITVRHACVGVTGGIQPSILLRSLGVENRENGLAARLLMAYPPRRVRIWSDTEVDREATTAVERVFKKIFELPPVLDGWGNPGSGVVLLTPDAKRMLQLFFADNACQQVELDGDMASAWSKFEEYAARFALIFHFVRWAAGDPGLQSVEYLDDISMGIGIMLVEWFKDEARRIYDMIDASGDGGDNGQKVADTKLLQWVVERGGRATVKQVREGCRWLRGSGEAEAALEELATNGKGRWKNVPPDERGGRPTREFVV